MKWDSEHLVRELSPYKLTVFHHIFFVCAANGIKWLFSLRLLQSESFLFVILTCAHPTVAQNPVNTIVWLYFTYVCSVFFFSCPVFEEPEDPSNRSFFSEIISSISDVKFSHNGRYMMTRDYLSVKIWDLNMENRPVETYQVRLVNRRAVLGCICRQIVREFIVFK